MTTSGSANALLIGVSASTNNTYKGTGTLNLTTGASLTVSNQAYVGYTSGGTLNLTGPTASMNVGSTLYVGYESTGSLTLTGPSASLNTAGADIGGGGGASYTGSTGTVSLSGSAPVGTATALSTSATMPPEG